MNGIRTCVLCLMFFLTQSNVSCTDPQPGTQQFMDKKQIMKMIESSVKGLLDPSSVPPEEAPSLKRYLHMLTSISHCLKGGDLKKNDLISCMNKLISDFEMTAPPEFLSCMGEYIMCTGHACLSKLKYNYQDNQIVKCLVDCLPRAVVCISRTNPVRKRYTDL